MLIFTCRFCRRIGGPHLFVHKLAPHLVRIHVTTAAQPWNHFIKSHRRAKSLYVRKRFSHRFWVYRIIGV